MMRDKDPKIMDLATISITTTTSFGIGFTILDMGNQYNLIHEYLGVI